MEKAEKLKKEEMEKIQKANYNMTDDAEQAGGYIKQIEKELVYDS